MPDAREVYRFHPDMYDALVRCEDRAGNLIAALQEIAPVAGADIVELGAGTGRVTALLLPLSRRVVAFDNAPAMLGIARERLFPAWKEKLFLGAADNAKLPVWNEVADLAVAGWTYGHQTVWNEQDWRRPIEDALGEMLRTLKRGGKAIVIETLGTGHVEPFTPPLPLSRYYDLLERDFGFERRWVRTDYAFASKEEGERLLRFFFGEARAHEFASRDGTDFPECTGIWSREK